MKYALIADIHSNLEAFTTVLDRIKKEKVDKIYCAGDIIGYGPNPVECIELIIKNNIKTVRGNHEELDKYSEEQFSEEEGSVLNWTKTEIKFKKRKYLDYLINLPRTISEEDIFIIHNSSFKELHEGIKEDDIDLQNSSYNRAKKRFLVVGHTHKPFARKIKNGYIINPGSIGQPRDGNLEASFSILDTKIPDVKNFRLEYDVDTTIVKIMLKGLPLYFAKRLLTGL